MSCCDSPWLVEMEENEYGESFDQNSSPEHKT